MASHKNLRIAVIFGIFIAALTGIQHSAFAACTSPAGIAGGITWNGTDSVIWCDGTNWYALKSSGASGSAGYIQFSNGSAGFSNSGTTAGQQLFWDNTNKRLGIGTVTPSATLEAHSYRTQARLKSFNEWPTGSSDVLLARSRGWTIGTPQHVLLRDAIGVFAGVSNNGGTDSLAGMSVYATQDHTDTAHGMGLSLFTTPNDGVNASARMIISQSGNIGIGTDIDPIYTLTFAKEGTRTIGIERSSPNNNGSNLIVTAGGAVSSVADKFGGSLVLSSGIATGTGSSSIVFRTATPQASTATTDNTPTDKMTILGNGNVGISTTTPTFNLGIGAGNTRTIGVERNGGGAGNDLYIHAGGAKSGGTDLAGGDLYFRSGISTGTGASAIYFQTRPPGTAGTADNSTNTAMSIVGNGNVGIGLTGPTYPFVVSGNTGSGWTLGVAEFRNNNTSTIIRIKNTTAGGREWGLSSSGTGANEGVGNFNIFDLTASATRLSINSSGNVGIGTTSPAAKLDVNGFMRLAKNGSAPATCDATIDGAIALTSARRMCVCDATSWVEVNSATACTW